MTRGRTQPVSHGDAESGQLLQVQRVLIISGDSRPPLPVITPLWLGSRPLSIVVSRTPLKRYVLNELTKGSSENRTEPVMSIWLET